MCVCVCICIYLRMYVYSDIVIYMYIHIHTHTQIYTDIYNLCICIYVYTSVPPPALAFTSYSFTAKHSCTSQSCWYCLAHMHCSNDCNTKARLLRNIRPLLGFPFVCHTPYNFGSGNIV